MQVVVDTNFFLIPALYQVDIFAEFDRVVGSTYTVCAVSSTVSELTQLKENAKRLSHRMAANVGIGLLKRVKIIESTQANADDAIVAYATKHAVIVATQDQALKKRIKALGRSVIVLRHKDHLEKIEA